MLVLAEQVVVPAFLPVVGRAEPTAPNGRVKAQPVVVAVMEAMAEEVVVAGIATTALTVEPVVMGLVRMAVADLQASLM